MAIREPTIRMRRLDSYAQGRPLGRALLESALTIGVMMTIVIAVLALRVWYAVGGP
jgi:hypothetical protein